MTEKASRAMSLLKLVEERASLRKILDQEKKLKDLESIPYLPKDCISNILIRLSLESLQRSRFVCKPWYSIINSPIFVRENLRRAEPVLMFLSPIKRNSSVRADQDTVFREKPNTFSVEAKIFEVKSVHVLHQPLIHPTSKFALMYMLLAEGKSVTHDLNVTCLGAIRASCDGLIVVENKMKHGELVIMNPVTREMSLIPVGTIYPPHEESFGLAYCQTTGEYKLVHLFRDESQFVGCEILRIGQKAWRVIDGPCFGLFGWFGYEPVFAIGALHWIPEIDHSDHIVSMTIDDEKFHKIMLPKSSRYNDRVMEACEHLCYVAHEEVNEISVWFLPSLLGETWTKVYTIAVGCIRDMIPLYCSRLKWEMYFMDKDGSVFAFGFQDGVMRKLEVKNRSFVIHRGSYRCHVNSLVSWQVKDKNQDAIDP